MNLIVLLLFTAEDDSGIVDSRSVSAQDRQGDFERRARVGLCTSDRHRPED